MKDHPVLERAKDPQYRTISQPNAHALMLLGEILSRTDDPAVCEVGIGVGATSLALCDKLAGRGEIHFYDFAEKVEELRGDLETLGFRNVSIFGNSHKRYDSYNWNLARQYRAMLAGDARPYDFAFLDGAHVFHHDAPATAVLKEMIAPGGILLFDDYDWSHAVSPTLNPEVAPHIREEFTDDQIAESHVALICSVLIDPDPRFTMIEIGFKPGWEHRRAYRRAR